jgi:hypothetical protein
LIIFLIQFLKCYHIFCYDSFYHTKIEYVGTLRTGYPAYKLQVKTTTPASRLRAAPRPSCVHMASAPDSGQLRGRHVPPRLGIAPGPPRAPVTRGSSGAAMCHLASSTHLLGQGSSRAVTCHLGYAGCKQINKYLLATRPS